MDKNVVLQLQTFPACSVGLNRFRKEVIKTGHYTHPGTKQEFDVTVETLNHWATTFSRYLAGGNKVPIPLGHAREGLPEANAGWVTDMVVEGDSLMCIMDLADEQLALTTDVSICIEEAVTDSKGVTYKNIITNVALCTNPVIVGLEKFTKLSLSIGETSMDFLKKLAKKLGVVGDTPTEESIMLALDTQKKVDEKKVADVKLSAEVVIDPVVKLVSENRAMKLSNLVNAGLITPAVKDVIEAKYVKTDVLAMSLASKVEDGFDLLYDVLVANRPAKLGEVTGLQSLELSKISAEEPNVMAKAVTKARADAGMKD